MAGTYRDSQVPRARSARQQFWLEHLSAWQAQGTSLRAYAAANRFSSSSLYRARRMLERRGMLSGCEEAPATFVPVRVTACCAGVSSASAQRGRRRGPRAHRARALRDRARMRERAAMIRPAHHGIEVWLCVEPVDFRKQITGLATLVQDQLSMDPFSAQLFVFTNRRRNQTTFYISISVRDCRVSMLRYPHEFRYEIEEIQSVKGSTCMLSSDLMVVPTPSSSERTACTR